MPFSTFLNDCLRPVVLCGCTLLPTVAVDAAIIDIQPQGAISGSLVRLADVADILDSDPQVQRQLEAITLGPAPAPGRKLKVTQQSIRERLLAHGVNLTEIEFTGQSLVLIENVASANLKRVAETSVEQASLKPVSTRTPVANPALHRRANELVQAAFHRLYHSSDNDSGPLTLTVEIEDRDVEHLVRANMESLRFVESGLSRGGPQTLTVQFPDGSGTTRVIKMQAWLNDTPQIVTVKHSVPKGQVLQHSDLVRTPAKPGQTGIEHPESLIGKEVTRHLTPGSPVQHNDLAKVPLVRANDLVTVKARSGGISVSRSVRAISNGAEGDVIFFTALDNPREKIQARVTGWHEAEIVELSADTADAPRGRLK